MKRRLLGEHFKRDGKPKRGFATHAQALVEMERSNKAHAYRCKFCRQWHVAGRKVSGPHDTVVNTRTGEVYPVSTVPGTVIEPFWMSSAERSKPLRGSGRKGPEMRTAPRSGLWPIRDAVHNPQPCYQLVGSLPAWRREKRTPCPHRVTG